MKHSIFIACFVSLAAYSAISAVGQQGDAGLAQEWDNASAIPTSNCLVETNRQIEIAVDVPGTLVKLEPSRRGGVVTKGQVVVEIQNSRAKAELAELKHKAQSTVSIKFAQQSIDSETLRLDGMKQRNAKAESEIFTPNEIREQELLVVKAKAELEKAKEDKVSSELAAVTKEVELTQYVKVSEIDGIVTDLHSKSVGTSIRQGDPIMTIVDYDEMLVKMEVDPQYETQIGVGDRVLVKRTSSTGTTRPKEKRAPRGTGNVFGTTATTKSEPITTSAPAARQAPEYFFEGEVTFTSGQVKSGQSGSARQIVIEAVVRNRMAKKGNYLLKEGVRIEAKIIPQ